MRDDDWAKIEVTHHRTPGRLKVTTGFDKLELPIKFRIKFQMLSLLINGLAPTHLRPSQDDSLDIAEGSQACTWSVHKTACQHGRIWGRAGHAKRQKKER